MGICRSFIVDGNAVCRARALAAVVRSRGAFYSFQWRRLLRHWPRFTHGVGLTKTKEVGEARCTLDVQFLSARKYARSG
jgi:hypothetical protein